MNNKARPDLLSAPLFITGLLCLLTNDFFFKYEFSNALTGKLSDIAGLFIFPYFFAAYRPKKAKIFYWATVILFFLWKSSLSQGFINLLNSYGVGLGRVIDYTDLLALLILPISYNYFKTQLNKLFVIKGTLSFIISCVSLFAFCATTLPYQKVENRLDVDKSFVLDISKASLLDSLRPASVFDYSDSILNSPTDSIYYLYFQIPENGYEATARAAIYDIDSSRVLIHLDSLLYGYVTGSLFGGIDKTDVEKLKAIKPQEFERYFKLYFIDELKKKKSMVPLRYDNKAFLERNNIEIE